MTAQLRSPQYVIDDVERLLSDLTTPETQVKFDAPSRANPATIQNTISPPAATWHWATNAAQVGQNATLNPEDVGKYGLQDANHTMYRLASVTPDVVWQPIQTFSTATWTWPNVTGRLGENIAAADVGKIGLQTDIDTYYQLTDANPAIWQQVPNPTDTSAPFELSTGASDADSYHDFFRLQVAFEDVWVEMLDQRIKAAAELVYATWNAIMTQSGDYKGLHASLAPNQIASVDELNEFLGNLKYVLGISDGNTAPSDASPDIAKLKDVVGKMLTGCEMLLNTINWAATKPWNNEILFMNQNATLNADPHSGDPWGNDLDQLNSLYPDVSRGLMFESIRNDLNSVSPPAPSAPPDVTFTALTNLLTELDGMLKEPYRFDVFAPGSINYGLLLNYRQHWQPQSYQVGNLVSTIPLAPQETRRYTTKSVVKKTRNIKEIDDSLRSGKDEIVRHLA